MTDTEVLQRAIEIAIKQGFNPGPSWYSMDTITGHVEELDSQQYLLKSIRDNPFMVKSIIYNHEFAKSLFGEYGYIPEAQYKFQYKKNSGVEKTRIFTIASAVSPWQYHLQMMVISPDPIDYLRNYIKENP